MLGASRRRAGPPSALRHEAFIEVPLRVCLDVGESEYTLVFPPHLRVMAGLPERRDAAPNREIRPSPDPIAHALSRNQPMAQVMFAARRGTPLSECTDKQMRAGDSARRFCFARRA